MRLLALLLLVTAVAALPDSQRRHRGIGHAPTHKTAAHRSDHLRYDEVYGVATHNSYWIDRSALPEEGASGTQERILDQLLHDRVRAIELDVHFNGKRPGVWSVYHTNNLGNSFCATLDECLKSIQLFHHLVPRHDVVNVVIELKELWGHVFDGAHTIAQLDDVLRRSLGDALYTPRDFAARCPTGSTLRACARSAGWPTVEELRGKFIVNVLGSFNYNANDWVDYATAGGGVLARAAFPMRAILDESGGGCTGLVDEGVHDAFEPATLAAAREASIFWQVEQLDYADIGRFLDEHGVIRGQGSSTWAEQRDRLRRGFQLLQTDHPWHVLGDAIAPDGAPADTAHRLRDTGAPAQGVEPSEPGSRWYVSGAGDDGLVVAARRTDALSSDWQTMPSTTRPDAATRWYFDWARLRFVREALAARARPRGVGCLRAAAAAGREYFMVCRQTIDDEYTRVTIRARGPDGVDSSRAVGDAGELLRLQLTTSGDGSCARAFVAGELDHGAPAWRPVASECFSEKLVEQGIAATRDVLFVGTRHDDAAVDAASLVVRGGRLFDQSADELGAARNRIDPHL